MTRKLLTLLILCLLLAVLRAALIILALAVTGLFLWALITKPRTTLAFIGTLTLAFLINTHPVFWVMGLALLGVAVFWPRPACKSEQQPQLTQQ